MFYRSSGTAGLHMAFNALNIKKNDIIIMPVQILLHVII